MYTQLDETALRMVREYTELKRVSEQRYRAYENDKNSQDALLSWHSAHKAMSQAAYRLAEYLSIVTVNQK